jgi:hypothetical protein
MAFLHRFTDEVLDCRLFVSQTGRQRCKGEKKNDDREASKDHGVAHKESPGNIQESTGRAKQFFMGEK